VNIQNIALVTRATNLILPLLPVNEGEVLLDKVNSKSHTLVAKTANMMSVPIALVTMTADRMTVHIMHLAPGRCPAESAYTSVDL
jgi:hypothetical protein